MEKEPQRFVKAKPEILPGPAYVPFMLAMSLVFFGWGLISYWLISIVGLAGMGISIYYWIKILIDERAN